ncbi:MAG: SpoIIE family protein phosphatase [Bacteroidetes bacterium]|nr:SpoIIE family protein phosphatase [Bacteroidota bacterium]MBX7045709.1 SpoIIE family protein phosphatase [Ignavibacteria bacterium]
MLSRKLSENTIRTALIVITTYFVILFGAVILKAFLNPLGIDDSVKSVSQEGKYAGMIYFLNVEKDGATDKAGIKSGDILLAINGEKITALLQDQHILNALKPNEIAEYTVIRNDREVTVNVKVRKYFHLLFYIFALLGFLFLLIGFLVGYSAPKEKVSLLFYFLGMSCSLGFMVYGGVQLYFVSSSFVFLNCFFFSLLFPPVLVHFFATYPLEYGRKYRKLLIFLNYFILFGFEFGLNLNFIYKIIELPFVFYQSMQYINLVYIIAALLFFIKSFFKIKDEQLKKSLKIILFGFIIGGLGFIYYFLLLSIVYTTDNAYNVLLRIPAIAVLAIPLTLGYSIFKYRILETEFIIKKSLVFGIVTAFIVGFYLFAVYLIDSIITVYFNTNKQIVTIAIVIIITFTFDFVNKRAKEYVDKILYREVYNYRKSLLEFTNEIQYLPNIKQIIESFARIVKKSMGVKRMDIIIKELDYFRLLQETDYLDEKQFGQYEEISNVYLKLFAKDKNAKQLYHIKLNELNLNEKDRQVISETGIVLAVPIIYSDNLIGVLNFGEKESGKAYSDEDIDLLTTLSSHCAVAFENSRLLREEIEKKKLEEELLIARNIQAGLLPKLNKKLKSLDVSGISISAKEIGGDFYDCIEMEKDKYLFVIGDVSGKGIPAALYMAKIQAMIQFASGIYSTPKEILQEVNKLIYDSLDKKSFVTIELAIFDLHEKKVKICRAGHNPSITIKKDEVNFVSNTGIGIGLDKEKVFNDTLTETEISLYENAAFVFYTDGLTEAFNEKKELYSQARLSSVLSENMNKSAVEITDACLDDLKQFRGAAEQNDDITLLVVKITE